VLPFVSRVKDDFFSALASSQMKGKKKEKKKTLTICVSTSEGRQRERLLRLVNDGEVNYILFLHVHSHVSNLHAHHPIELVCFIGLDGRRNACLSSKRIHHPRHAGPKVYHLHILGIKRRGVLWKLNYGVVDEVDPLCLQSHGVWAEDQSIEFLLVDRDFDLETMRVLCQVQEETQSHPFFLRPG